MVKMKKIFNDIKELGKRVDKLYIYGAGLYANRVYRLLGEQGIRIDGFVVTKMDNNNSIDNLPIMEYTKLADCKMGIILGLNKHNAKNVYSFLEKSNFCMEDVIDARKLVEGNTDRGGFDEVATIEITTVMGCSVNCRFCPQKLLLDTYYKTEKNRSSTMSMENFLICLEKMPEGCNVVFAGMSEPLLNKNCIDMIKEAVNSGRNVDLYTTLVGATSETIEEICKIPFQYFTLHVADKYNYAHINKTEEYYTNVEKIVNCKKDNGQSLVGMCSAQAEPDKRVTEICKDKYEIFYNLHNRAGNLECDSLYGKKNICGPITCGFCGSNLNHNILLPDGTLLLCCMDYGMKHVLGNLLFQEYEEIMNGEEIERIKTGMIKDESIDILCRNCSSCIKI